ncbi:hypothetical protein COY95_00970 [Candidatus Woesearchaeota archaeon CG_4_10_14_0_8_um_filter_47_5]|nr:MAG: hypothetical protein COY95_00970 [Candidatus Woesearchaeota archaeon CG_4_10_14_0_8_um_filter_47_5]
MDEDYTEENAEEDQDEEEMDSEDLVHYTDDKVDALISLLIKKGVISEQEFDAAYEELFEEDGNDSSKG